MKVLQFELAQSQPNLAIVVDAGCKVVHNRVAKLMAAGDLGRIVAAAQDLSKGTRPIDAATRAGVVSALSDCIYRDEAQRVALALLDTTRFQSRDLAAAMRAAADLFSDQVVRSEVVFRLPRDGPAATRELAVQLAEQMATRTAVNLVHQHNQQPEHRRSKRWRAPRARTKKSDSEKMGNDLDL